MSTRAESDVLVVRRLLPVQRLDRHRAEARSGVNGLKMRRARTRDPGPPLCLCRQPFRIRWSGFRLHELPAVADWAAQVSSTHPIGLILLQMAAVFLPDGHRASPERETAITAEPTRGFPGALPRFALGR